MMVIASGGVISNPTVEIMEIKIFSPLSPIELGLTDNCWLKKLSSDLLNRKKTSKPVTNCDLDGNIIKRLE